MTITSMLPAAVRNRIVEHVTVRAGDLLPHPLNYRLHPDAQRQALAASYEEIGFARSLLGYRLADGRIQLIDGHLRRELDPELPVVVEILDVSDEEARKLLLTLDPLTALAQADEETLGRLRELTATDAPALRRLWDLTTGGSLPTPPPESVRPPAHTEQYLVLVECTDEEEQMQLLERFQAEGLRCKALLS